MTVDTGQAGVGQLFERHVSSPMRDASRALAMTTARWMWRWLEDNAAGRRVTIWDLGAGFSSMVFRLWQRDHDAEVWTTDDGVKWLERTKYELARDGLSSDRCMLHETFVAAVNDGVAEPAAHLIFLDLATSLRMAQLPMCAAALRPGGVLVLDDWHLESVSDGYAAHRTAVARAGLRLQLLTELEDEWGRYPAVMFHVEH